MAKFQKGDGRSRKPKGAQNKISRDIKEAFKNLIELNTPNMINWMQSIAKTDPAKALSLCADLAEFIVPKLARTEMTGKDGKELTPIKIERVIVNPPNTNT